ncbi:Nucleoside triphosphate pyrophosphohydrolase MazG [hydrothermal vent metagenome]|uniref:Nucleoside triphosphate pyrophosphohydrolase MazG n=1 Tax=hydrothermal vent metagenome TaxID=652676 RepID=A0A3B1DBM3_9ZZZZ
MDFDKLVKIMEALRAEDGCPWDREQTRQSLKPFLIEEAYELLEAIEEDDPVKIKEELGDLLFQIVFHARIAGEKGEFDIRDVIEAISGKMVSRHPHVFGGKRLRTADEVLDRWEEHKRQEGKLKESIFEGIPGNLPSLLKAHMVQERVSRVGFDWEKAEDVVEKVESEFDEFKSALKGGDKGEIEEEFGDILFTLVNLSRFVDIDPEEALRKTISRFIRRFSYIETSAKQEGRALADYTLEEMDHLWEEAKRAEKYS